ncbi:MAG: cysteine hydrolase family protein [Bacilli bacterium]
MKLTKNDKLIIIDMINGFAFEGALSSPNVAKLIPGIKKLIETSLENNIEVVHYTDSHPKNCKEFLVYPPHCIEGSNEAKIISELNFDEITIIKKNSTNGFLAKNPFEDGIKNLYIVGCVSDICIFDFAYAAIKYVHEKDLNINVNVIENLCATFDAENHDSQEVHANSMKKLENAGVNIIHI